MRSAHALKVWGVSPELGILVGVAGAAALANRHRLHLSIRRQGIYFPDDPRSRCPQLPSTSSTCRAPIHPWRELGIQKYSARST